MLCLRKFATVVAAVVFASSAFAGNTWNGGGSTVNWSDTGNWGGSAPAFGTMSFSGSARTVNTLNGNFTAGGTTNTNQVNWNGSSAWTMNAANGAVLNLFDNSGTQSKLESLGGGGLTINAPITYAATSGAAWGELNAVGSDITFGSAGTLTVNGSRVDGLKLFGSNHVVTFNNIVNASGKWFAMTANPANTVAIGGAFTSGDIYVMNGGMLSLNAGGSLTTSAVRLGGDFGKTLTQDLTKGALFRLTAPAGGQTFVSAINSVGGNTSNALVLRSLATTGTNTVSGSIFLDSPLTIQTSAGGSLLLGGTSIDVKSQRLTIDNAGPVAVTNGIASSTNAGSLSKSGAGSLTLNGNASYLGGTIINGGIILLGVTNALPATSGSLALGGTGATLDLNGFNQTVVGLNDNGGLTSGLVTNNGTADATLTVNDSGLDIYAGTIGDGARLVALAKSGPGVMTLAGGNTYSGATTINGGTLALGLGGSLGNTAITVNAGTFSPIQGSSAGTVGASLVMKSGATLDLTSGGTGAVGTFTLNSGGSSFAGTVLDLQGATLKFDLGSNTADQLIVNGGAASVSGTNYITIIPASGLSGLTTGTRTLISAPGGGLAGTFRFTSGSPLNVVSQSITVSAGGNSYRLFLNSTPTALELVIENAPPKVPVNIMPLGASITEGASADNPYNGGGYRSKLYQYLANDGRSQINFVGSNTRLFEFNPTAPNILTTAGQLHNEGHFGSATYQIQNNLNGYDNSNANGSNNGGYWLAPGNGVNPNYITLNVGGNDYVANPNDPFVVDRLNQIINTVSDLRPGVTVLVSNLAWRQQVGPSINSRYNPYVPGMVYAQILNGHHVQFVDMYSVMSPNDSTANLSSDLIHPSQGGYNLMADTWWKSFAFGAAFWTGNQDTNWNTLQPNGLTNWARDYTRAVDRQALLDPGTDVYFNGNNTPITTTLGADVSVRGLNFAAGASAPVTIGGNNTLTLGSGGMTVQAGTAAHVISANVSLGADQTWSNISGNPLTVNGVLGGSAALKLVGPSFFNFGGANTSSGSIGIDSGGLFLSATGNLSGQGFVYVGSGAPSGAGVNASLLANNTTSAIPNAIVTNKAETGSGLGSGTRTIGGTNIAGTVTFSGAIYLNGGTVLSSTAGGTTAFTNAIANGIDTGNISRAVTIAGSGTVLLAGNNTYTGGTSINSGALQVGSSGTLPSGFVFVGNGGASFGNVNASFLSANTSTPIGNAIVTNKADLGPSLGAGARTIGGANNSGTATFNGAIFINGGAVLTAASGGIAAFTNAIADGSDTGNVSNNVTIAGPGTVRLAANNTYSGATTVTGGTLQLDGSIAGSVAVNPNARLTGTGTINQNLTIAAGGIAQFNGGTFTVHGTVTNNGLFILSNGAIIAGTQSFINNGTLDLINAGTFTPPPGFQNNGTIIDASNVKVRNASKTGSSVSVSIDSFTGHTYQLQYSATLSVAFTNVGAAQQGSTGTTLTFSDPNAAGTVGFYRVTVAP